MSNGNSRQRLSEWLKDQLIHGNPGIQWKNPSQGEFKIPWLHKSKMEHRGGNDIFTAWAKHTGLYAKMSSQDKDKFSQFKANFRSALNKAPDIEYLPEESTNNERVYRFQTKSRSRGLEAHFCSNDYTQGFVAAQENSALPLAVAQEFDSSEMPREEELDPFLDMTGSDSNSSSRSNTSSSQANTSGVLVYENTDIPPNNCQQYNAIQQCTMTGPASSPFHSESSGTQPIDERGCGQIDDSIMSLGSEITFDMIDAVNPKGDSLGSLPFDLKPVVPFTGSTTSQQYQEGFSDAKPSKPDAAIVTGFNDGSSAGYSQVINVVNPFYEPQPLSDTLVLTHNCPGDVQTTNLLVEVIHGNHVLATYHVENPKGCIIAYKQVSMEQLMQVHGRNRMDEFYGLGYEQKQFIDLESVISSYLASFPDTKTFTKCLKRGLSLQIQDRNILLERNTSLKIAMKATLDSEVQLLPSRSVQKEHRIFCFKQFLSNMARYWEGKEKHRPSPSVYLCLTEPRNASESNNSSRSMELIIRVTNCEVVQFLKQVPERSRHTEQDSILESLDKLSIN